MSSSDYSRLQDAYPPCGQDFTENFTGVKPAADFHRRSSVSYGKSASASPPSSSLSVSIPQTPSTPSSVVSTPSNASTSSTSSHSHYPHHPHHPRHENNYYYNNYYRNDGWYPRLIYPGVGCGTDLCYNFQPRSSPYIYYNDIPLTFWEFIENNLNMYPDFPSDVDVRKMTDLILNLSKTIPCGARCKQYVDYYIYTYLKSYDNVYQLCADKKEVIKFFVEFKRDVWNNFGYDIRRTETIVY